MPAAHYLETWGDALTSERLLRLDSTDDSAALRRTLGNRSDERARLGSPKWKDRNSCRKLSARRRRREISTTAWNKFLHDGFAAHITPKDQPPTFNGNTAGGVAHTLWTNESPRRRPDSPEIVLVGSYSMDDGRYINNGWLQEMPDPITKLTWDNAAMMSPAFAKHIGVKDGDLVEVTITERRRSRRRQLKASRRSDSAAEETDPAPARHRGADRRPDTRTTRSRFR